MNPANLPSMYGTIRNGFILNRELAKSLSQLEVYIMNSGTVSAGAAKLKATLTAAIAVIDDMPARTKSIAITPATVTLSLAGTTTQQLVVTKTPLVGSTSNVASTSVYSSSDPTKATVSATGLVTAVAVGTTVITATFGGATATKLVTVTA